MEWVGGWVGGWVIGGNELVEGGWVGGWVGDGKGEENEAVGMSYCELGVEWMDGRKRMGRWVGGWVGGFFTSLSRGWRTLSICLVSRKGMSSGTGRPVV